MSAIGGFDSDIFDRLEKWSDIMDWTQKGSPEYERAARDYQQALHALAAMRDYQEPSISEADDWKPVKRRPARPAKAGGYVHNLPRMHSAARRLAA